MGTQNTQNQAADFDKKIEENIQKRELMKLRKGFYQNLKQYYQSRKYKEFITLNCADKCIKTFREDDLTRSETVCLMNCYNKYYRYLAYSNTLYSYIINTDFLDDSSFEPELESPNGKPKGEGSSLMIDQSMGGIAAKIM
ncbi:UNKNOWN [Stylonychia lemnae]|uniref:Mitochondrial import inner membrane translocase subunit n=1 Tax=Stylonychia lemnae TaxID=5949 RepID=A0A077ZZL9_STYLE|nr:UNKNOWN [Stylonychia lemnae]|eukprot:CDW75330.1 UNKNOWN [Stylonychia lemnae]